MAGAIGRIEPELVRASSRGSRAIWTARSDRRSLRHRRVIAGSSPSSRSAPSTGSSGMPSTVNWSPSMRSNSCTPARLDPEHADALADLGPFGVEIAVDEIVRQIAHMQPARARHGSRRSCAADARWPRRDAAPSSCPKRSAGARPLPRGFPACRSAARRPTTSESLPSTSASGSSVNRQRLGLGQRQRDLAQAARRRSAASSARSSIVGGHAPRMRRPQRPSIARREADFDASRAMARSYRLRSACGASSSPACARVPD